MPSSPKPRPRHRAVLLSGALIAALLPCRAQDTTFYSKSGGKVLSLNGCDSYMVSGPDLEMPGRLLRVIRTKEGLPRIERRIILDGKDSIPDGISRWYDTKGTLRLEREYARGAIVRIASFREQGQPRRLDLYANDSLVSGNCFRKDGSPEAHYPFLTPPMFKGGMDSLYVYMRANMRYPKKAAKKDIVGKVLVAFIVDTDGTIIDAQVVRPVDPLLDAEALRLVRGMPPWEPGHTDDIPVRGRYTLPVVFSTGAGTYWAD